MISFRHLKVNIFYKFIFLVLVACGGDSNDENIDIIDDIISPSNLSLEIDVVNSDSNNPNGDGSGMVIFKVTANDAEKYKIITGSGDEIESTSGTINYTYSQTGVNNYTVTAYAYSSTGHSVSLFKGFSIYVEEPPLSLVWSDEFDTDGAINADNWTAEIVPPDNQVNWWNGEKQHYTDRLDNAYVSDGTLKIVAKKETYTFINSRNENITKEYTSARINTQDKFEFTYGKIDVRAKLPKGQGTWPAIWTLGANIDQVNWPACGEIDIMEHWGHEPTEVSSATHNTACHGGCGDVTVGKTILTDYDTEFHVYSIVWTEDEIRFLIDDEYKYKYRPQTKNNDNWPYQADQFIILNVAMGGSWFSIDSDFTESIMEVDYVRVYQ